MDSLTKNRQSRQTIEKMVFHIFQCSLAHDEDAIVELKEGWFNVAYFIRLADHREVVLKIAPPASALVMTYERDMMKSEVTLMKRAYDLGIPCPRVYGYDDTHKLCDADYFFMEKCDGSNFEHVRDALDEHTRASIHHQIGQWTYRWNQNISNHFGYVHNKDLQGSTWKEAFLNMVKAVLNDGENQHVNIGFSYDIIFKIYQKYAYSLDEVTYPQFVHWDCWDSNVFVKDGTVTGVLDFERGFFGDPLAEALFRMRNQQQLQGYGKVTFTPLEEMRMRLYDGYLYLIMIVEDKYRHYPTDDIRQYGYHQLTRWANELMIM
jgi:hypothetical protein